MEGWGDVGPGGKEWYFGTTLGGGSDQRGGQSKLTRRETQAG